MKTLLVSSVLALDLTIAPHIYAQDQAALLEVTQVTENLHMLSGQGGNIAVFTGPDGTFVIDDQMAPVVPELMEKIKELGGETPRFLINTHYHFDHAGGNELMGGQGITIVAHENTRARLASGSEIPTFDAKTPPAPPVALPVITYQKEIHFHLNGDEIRSLHLPRAHTDGDSAIHFTHANVLHTGDVFFNGFYPFIDTFNGGGLAGTIAAAQKMLDMADNNTKIIPGHGPLASRSDLVSYQDMLTFAHAALGSLKKEDKTLEEALAAKPLAQYDEEWSDGLFTTDIWIGLIYGSL